MPHRINLILVLLDRLLVSHAVGTLELRPTLLQNKTNLRLKNTIISVETHAKTYCKGDGEKCSFNG